VEYYSTPETANMISYFGDLESMIMDREIEIMQALTDVCVKFEVEINNFAEVVAELDWSAIAQLSSYVADTTQV
jgi:DNA mismatch repair ATPase MutS